MFRQQSRIPKSAPQRQSDPIRVLGLRTGMDVIVGMRMYVMDPDTTIPPTSGFQPHRSKIFPFA